jgi:hypothetical protein
VLRPAHIQAMPVHGQARLTDTVWPGWDGVPWLCQLGCQVVDTGHGEFERRGKEEEGGGEMTAAAAGTTRGPRWRWQRWAARQRLGQQNSPSWEETRWSQQQRQPRCGGWIRLIRQQSQCLGGSEEALMPDVKDLESPSPLPRSGTTCWCQLGGTVSAVSIISSFSLRTTPLTRDRGWCGRSLWPAMPRAAVHRMQ